MIDSNQKEFPVNSVLMDEIRQQPILWPTTMDRTFAAGIEPEFLASPVVVTGAGTSAYAGSAIAAAWPGATAIPTTDLLLQSAEEIERTVPSFSNGGLLISLARSGDSPESVAVVKRVQKMFPAVRHLAIVCNADGRLAHLPEVKVVCLDPRTNDKSLAMTGSFSNLVLAGLSLIHREQIAKHLGAIRERASQQLPQMNRIAQEIVSNGGDRLVVLTSKMHALAQETSIKVVELTSGRTMPMPETFLGLRHGPVSFLRTDSLVLCFASSDATTRLYEVDLVRELRSRGLGRLILVAESAAGWEYDWFVPSSASALPDYLRTPFEVPFSQLLAYQLSRRNGIDPDNPSPDATVTRVVTQFRTYDESSVL